MNDRPSESRCTVTVLMPVYNAEKYVGEAVQSILDQTFTDFELLIINDGCTDESEAVIRSFTDERIKIINNPKNLGLIASLNIGLEQITTKYIARADADDVCLPTRLQEQVSFMERHSEVGACGTWFDSLLPNGERVSGGRFSTVFEQIRLKHLYQIHIIHGTSMIRTSTVKEYHLRFNPEFRHAEDYDFFDRIGDVSQLANMPSVLYLIRQHDQRVSAKFSSIQHHNSDLVKQRILKHIGAEMETALLLPIEKLMYQDYAWFTMELAEELGMELRKLIAANDRSGYFETEFFRNEMSVRYLHLCNYLAGSHSSTLPLLKRFGMARLSDSPRLFCSIWTKNMLRHFSR